MAVFVVGFFSPALVGGRGEGLWVVAVWCPMAAVAVLTVCLCTAPPG
ncbi:MULTISPECIES: hypothetical protein [unclassified Nocardiopsis]|nr:hypothetical protein [Nocardiopsis sp. TSRI0078]